jgi:membrane-bound lytic murein transglycosylase D
LKKGHFIAFFKTRKFGLLANFIHMKKLFLFLWLLALNCHLHAQVKKQELKQDDPVLAMLDSLQQQKYFERADICDDTASLNIHGYHADSIPVFSDEIYLARLQKLDAESPFDLVFNEHVKKYIEVYTVKKRKVVSRVLGLSHLYFPLFEDALDRHGLPMELKYLAIVESALNPVAVSRSGAGGLWQFILSTGKLYGLKVNSYIDERRDPYLATEAACTYMKYLYKTFGDWQMVLAAYNCGPGAVSRAIRRSGGKNTYWELRPWLPTETQNYVPAFIAATYAMHHSADHNIYPVLPKKEFFFADTLKLRSRINLHEVSGLLGINYDDLSFLNPAYKVGIMPLNDKGNTLVLPPRYTGIFLQNQSLIETASSEKISANIRYASNEPTITKSNTGKKWIKVKRGETLLAIANAQGCSMKDIRRWNRLKSNRVKAGKVLVIHMSEKSSVNAVAQASPMIPEVQTQATDSLTPLADTLAFSAGPKVVFHVVQKGDTLWSIASRYKGTTVEEIKKANRLEHAPLRVGVKLKIPLRS